MSPFVAKLMLFIYRFMVIPPVIVVLPFVALFQRKIRAGMALRKVRVEPFPSYSPQPLWIHAASGEFEYAKSVIRELKTRDPNTPILVTYFSPTFAQSMH